MVRKRLKWWLAGWGEDLVKSGQRGAGELRGVPFHFIWSRSSVY